MRAVKPRRRDELIYRRDLRFVANAVAEATEERLFQVLERLEPQYLRDGFTRDDFGREIEEALGSLRRQFFDMQAYAVARAQLMVGRIDADHARRYFEEVKRTVGVDLAGVVGRERLDAVLTAKVRENVGLIKSIPEEYFAKLERLVYESTIQGRTNARGLQSEIRDLWSVTDRRAKFIARDQTAKLNSAINTERNLSLGIEEYVWRTSRDERVRESHRRKQGKVFRFDTPPADSGSPGEDFNCRCTARSIVPRL